jgi:aminopeptidase N
VTIWEGMFECKRFAGEVFDSRFSLPGTEPQYAPDRAFDTEHIRLEVKLDIPRKSLEGTCVTTLRALRDGADSVAFDAVHFRVLSVRSAGRPLKFDYDDKKLTVRLPAPVMAGRRVDVSVAYRVSKPKLGMYFIGPDRQYPDKPVQVWTQGEDEYARYWFPCHDAPQDRTTTEIIASVPKGMTAVSNGRLAGKSARGRNAVFHWKQDIPHATYLVTLAVGKFTEIKDKWRNVPVLYYCQPGREEDAKRAFGKTPEMMEFFSKSIGVPYAYPKYAQVAAVDFIYGGMENTSATTQTALTLHDERAHLDFSSDPLVAHELAHQWFGDLLTCKDWSHAWLNESFATYFEALFAEHDKGADEFAWELRQNAQLYFEEDREHYRRPISTKKYKQPSDLFDKHLYEKGSLVLHMLRTILGDKDFWRSMRFYVSRHKAGVVETNDLLNAVQDATGRNLGRFFDQWIFKAGHPEYKVRYWWDAAAREARVRVIQTQSTNEETGLFSMPLTFAFQTDGGEKRFTETVEKKSHLFKFKLPSEPRLALFDPDHAVLKKVDFPKSEEMWIRQLTRDPHVLGRADAAQALGRLGGPAAVKALREALFAEKFWGVQGEIARALGQIRTPEAQEVLFRAHDKLEHPKARRFVIAALGDLKSAQAKDRLRSRARREESYFAEIQSVKSLAQTGDLSLLSFVTDGLKAESWNDVLRSGALEAVAALRPPEAVAILKRHAAYGNAHTTRMTAIRGLAHLGEGREDVRKFLIGLLSDPFLLVQIAAVRAISQVGDERAVPALKKLTEGDRDGRLKRLAEEAVNKLRKGIEADSDKK